MFVEEEERSEGGGCHRERWMVEEGVLDVLRSNHKCIYEDNSICDTPSVVFYQEREREREMM